MGLLTTWGIDNKVITKGKTVIKDENLIFGTWTGTSVVASAASVTYGTMWKYQRKCTYSYMYVGMDYDTALDCANTLATYYTRNTSHYTWVQTAGQMGDWVKRTGGQMLMTRISVIHTDGKMWSVTVDVDETDTIMSKSQITPSWTAEDQRKYDYEVTT